MADESCGPAKPAAPSAPAKPGQRMVHCVKFDKDMPGLERVPWKGELGKRVYENVSAEAWKLWIEYSKMLVNEYRLNPLDPQSQKIMEEQMEQYFFGEGAKLPAQTDRVRIRSSKGRTQYLAKRHKLPRDPRQDHAEPRRLKSALRVARHGPGHGMLHG